MSQWEDSKSLYSRIQDFSSEIIDNRFEIITKRKNPKQDLNHHPPDLGSEDHGPKPKLYRTRPDPFSKENYRKVSVQVRFCQFLWFLLHPAHENFESSDNLV